MAISTSVGLVSGINFEDIVSRLMQVERNPIALQQTARTTLQAKDEAYNQISLRLNGLRGALQDIDSVLDFSKKKASSSDSASLAVGVSAVAAKGSFTAEVTQLASNERRASQGLERADSLVAASAGSFSYRMGASGPIKTVHVTGATTLTDLRDAINAAGGGVTANIINDGSSTGAFRLALSSTDTGAKNSIAILENDTNLKFTENHIEDTVAASQNTYTGTATASGTFTGQQSRSVVIQVTQAGTAGNAKFKVSLDGGVTFGADNEFTALTTAQDVSAGEGIQVAFSDNGSTLAVGDKFTIDAFNPLLQKAQDSILKVDGVTVQRAGNSFNDVLPGVSLTAVKKTDGPVTISVTEDKTGIASEIGEFVTAYNALVNEVKSRSNFDVDKQTAQPLFGDAAARTIQQRLASVVSGGVTSGLNSLSLSAIGIKTERNGTLSVDNAKLNTAIETDLESVRKMFAVVGDTASEGIEFVSAGTSTYTGRFGVSIAESAERAEIRGSQEISGSAGLTAGEILTFNVNGKTFQTVFQAGEKIDSIVTRLNSAFESNTVSLEASSEGGHLSIRSKDYGSSQSFNIASSADGAGQIGLGVGEKTVAGKDVVGTINGKFAKGDGQRLVGGVGTGFDGLTLLVTSTGANTTTVDLSRGVANRLIGELNQLTGSEKSLIGVRRDGLTRTVETINERIQAMEDRMVSREATLRKQFANLETVLAQLQSQSDFLSGQLAQIAGSSKR